MPGDDLGASAGSSSSEMFHSAVPMAESARGGADSAEAAPPPGADGSSRPASPQRAARLADDPGRQLHESWEAPRDGGAGAARLPSPPPEAPFANDPERWERQQRAQQDEPPPAAETSFDARWVEDVSRMAGEKGEEAVAGAMWGGREVYRRYRDGEITQGAPPPPRPCPRQKAPWLTRAAAAQRWCASRPARWSSSGCCTGWCSSCTGRSSGCSSASSSCSR